MCLLCCSYFGILQSTFFTILYFQKSFVPSKIGLNVFHFLSFISLSIIIFFLLSSFHFLLVTISLFVVLLTYNPKYFVQHHVNAAKILNTNTSLYNVSISFCLRSPTCTIQCFLLHFHFSHSLSPSHLAVCFFFVFFFFYAFNNL